MTHSEAFVETMRSHGVKDVFGIVGSAFMDPLDLFPRAGIRFISVQHEQNAAHMADGYYRASGLTGTCIAQNGPGILSQALPRLTGPTRHWSASRRRRVR
jgi:sulfoacetaldehyde acetyltransferase